jgi:hypothetical protein
MVSKEQELYAGSESAENNGKQFVREKPSPREV